MPSLDGNEPTSCHERRDIKIGQDASGIRTEGNVRNE